MWNVELTRITRFLIDDVVQPFTYTDARLEETLLVAVQLVMNDASFAVDYTIDVDQLTLSPDPTEGDKDDGFIALVCLRAALLVYTGIYKTKAATAGFSITSGRESISTAGTLDGYKRLWDKAAKDYADALWQYKAGNSTFGQLIIGPFAGNNVWTGDGRLF